MLKQILLAALLCFALHTTAQVSYQHYLDHTVRWTYEFSAGGAGAEYHNFTEYSVQGDTLIDTTWYWNIWARIHATFNGVPSDSYKPIFGMRETPDKKFYQYLYANQEETLMNDFNLKLGDTLQNDFNGVFLVDVIDTIPFGNEKRPLYRSIYPCGVIEGIGFIARDGSFNNRMVCFNKQESTYPQGSTACGFSAVEEVTSSTEFRFWPNPGHSELTIAIPSDLQKTTRAYRWYTATGQLHSAGTLPEMEAEVLLPLGDLQPGLYILMIGDEKQWFPLRVVVGL